MNSAKDFRSGGLIPASLHNTVSDPPSNLPTAMDCGAVLREHAALSYSWQRIVPLANGRRAPTQEYGKDAADRGSKIRGERQQIIS